MVYRSPWIVQLKRTRPVQRIEKHVSPDVVIVGGGIAGVVTAYFILQHTTNSVLVLEAERVAHGATGHNAGQVVSYFERPLHDIAYDYGAEITVKAYQDLIKTWDFLENLAATANLRTPITQFTGYAGYSTTTQIISQLKTLHLLSEAKNKVENILISKESNMLNKIPSFYHQYCSLISQKEIMQLLDTKDTQFIAAYPERKGCTNSSLLTEELIGYLLSIYPERFQLAEFTAAEEITVTSSGISIKTTEHTIPTSTVVLCTNGYTTYRFTTAMSTSSASPLHIKATVGYMNGYFDTTIRPAAATQFFTEQAQSPSDPYYYVTRRLYEHGRHAHTLLCVGGPEIALPTGQTYKQHTHYLPEAHHHLTQFITSMYLYPPPHQKPDFQWHGLMGYTPTMIRLIGADITHPNLFYNLGCNGVGILPSIYGGKRIAGYLRGDHLKPSIFDPAVQEKNHRNSR